MCKACRKKPRGFGYFDMGEKLTLTVCWCTPSAWSRRKRTCRSTSDVLHSDAS